MTHERLNRVSQEEETPAVPTPTVKTQVLPLSDPAAQATALALLAAEEIIVAPTDTVYGLMCRYDSPAAIARLYAAKDRPPVKAIPVLIAGTNQLERLVQPPLPPGARELMARFWPGALTLVLPALPHLPDILTAGLPSIAVRMPAHAGLAALLARSGPLAATSANRSGGPDSHTVAEVLAQLEGRTPLVLADDPTSETHSLASTIVDLTGPQPRLLRPGPLSQAVAHTLAELGLALNEA